MLFDHEDKAQTLRRAAALLLSLSCAGMMLAAAVPVGAMPAVVPEQEAPSQYLTTPIIARIVVEQPQAPAPLAEPAPAPAIDAASLKPGAYVWADEKAEGAPRVLVDISDQRAYLYRGETLVAVSTVSTGRPGHATPTGTFRITEKHAVHFSSKYDAAPMPFMQRLTNDGVALHAGRIPGHPASHGCVRLPRAFAQKLFGATRVGTEVVIAA